MADPKLKETVAQYSGADAGLQASLTELVARQQKEDNDAAAASIVVLMQKTKERVTNLAQAKIELEKQIGDHVAAMDEAQTALDFGLASNNYLPVIKVLGAGSIDSNVDKALLSVPKGWKKGDAVPAAAAA